MTCEAKSELRLFLCGELRLVYPAAVIVSVSSSILAKCNWWNVPLKYTAHRSLKLPGWRWWSRGQV